MFGLCLATDELARGERSLLRLSRARRKAKPEKEEDESQRAGGAAVVIELMEQREQSQRGLNSAESRQKKTKSQHNGSIISRDVISDVHTTEFRMMPFFGQNEQSYHFF